MTSSCGPEDSTSVGSSRKGTGVFIRSLVLDNTSAEPPTRGSKPVATPPVTRPSCYISKSFSRSFSAESALGLATGSQHPGTHSKPACGLTGRTAANRSPEFAKISNLSSSSPAVSYMPAERRNSSKLGLVWNSRSQQEPSARHCQQDSCLRLSRRYSYTGDAEIDEYGMKLCAAASTDSGLYESDYPSADGCIEQQRFDAAGPSSSSNMKAMARAPSLTASSSFRAAAAPPLLPPPPPLGCAGNSAMISGISPMQHYHSDAGAVTSSGSLAAAAAAAAATSNLATPFQLQCGVIHHNHHDQQLWPQPLPSQPINIQQHQHQFHNCQLQSDISSELQQAAAVSIPSNSNINSVHVSLRPQLQQQQQNQSNSLSLEECATLLQELQLQELQAAITAAATVSGCGSCGGSPVPSLQLPAVSLGSHHCSLDGLTTGLTMPPQQQQQQQQLLALLSSTPAYSTALDGTMAAAALLNPSTAPAAAATVTAPMQAQVPASSDGVRFKLQQLLAVKQREQEVKNELIQLLLI